MLGSKLEYIVIESRPDCMLDGINKLVLCDSFIFVSDSRKLLNFYRDGKFNEQIGSVGRGPGEYRFVGDFYIDNSDKKIYILDGRDVHIYDYQGNYRKSLTLDFVACQMILEDNNTFIFHDLNFYINVTNPMFQPNFPDTTYSIHITDSTGKNLIKIKHNDRQGNEPYINITTSPLYSQNGSITFLETGIDTAYHLHKLKREHYAVFNLGERKMDPHLVDKEKYGEEVQDKHWIASLTENIDFFFIDLYQGISDAKNYCLVNKQTGEATLISDLGLKNDLDDGPDFWPKQVSKDSILVSYIEAYKFLRLTKVDSQEKIEEIRLKLTENSNPVIILLK
jgi:6-bladed beta-propeller